MNNKEKIIKAYSNMAAKQGFYRVTMDELSAQAGVSKKTVYRYFESKEAIIEAVIDLFLMKVGNEIEEALSGNTSFEETLERVLSIFYNAGRTLINPIAMNDLSTHYPQFWEKINNYRMKRIHLFIDFLLRHNKNKHMLKFDPCIVTALLISAVQTILNPEFIIRNNLTFEEALEQLVEFMKYGFLNEASDENIRYNSN